MNPIQELNKKLTMAVMEVIELQEETTILRKSNKQLIEENVRMENWLEDIKASVADTCHACSEKATASCNECHFHSFAVIHKLWEE